MSQPLFQPPPDKIKELLDKQVADQLTTVAKLIDARKLTQMLTQVMAAGDHQQLHQIILGFKDMLAGTTKEVEEWQLSIDKRMVRFDMAGAALAICELQMAVMLLGLGIEEMKRAYDTKLIATPSGN